MNGQSRTNEIGTVAILVRTKSVARILNLKIKTFVTSLIKHELTIKTFSLVIK